MINNTFYSEYNFKGAANIVADDFSGDEAIAAINPDQILDEAAIERRSMAEYARPQLTTAADGEPF